MGYSLWGRNELDTTVRLTRFAVSKGFPGGSDSREFSCSSGDLDSVYGLGGSLEKGMAPHSSILAWEIPWTEESGGL